MKHSRASEKQRRHHRPGRPVQRPDAGARARSASPTQFGSAAASRSWRSTWSTRWCLKKSSNSAKDKTAVLVLEEGQPEFIEQEIATVPAARGRCRRSCTARTCMHMAGEYNVGVAGARPVEVPRAARAASEHSLRFIMVECDSETKQEAAIAARRAAGATADLLHRLPGAAGVLGDEAGGAGRSAGRTSRWTSAATPSPASSRSRRATRCSATA